MISNRFILILLSFLLSSHFLFGMQEVRQEHKLQDGKYLVKVYDNEIKVLNLDKAGKVIYKKTFKAKIKNVEPVDLSLRVELRGGTTCFVDVAYSHLLIRQNNACNTIEVLDEEAEKKGSFLWFKRFKKKIRWAIFDEGLILTVLFDDKEVHSYDIYNKKAPYITKEYRGPLRVFSHIHEKVYTKVFNRELEGFYLIGNSKILYVAFANEHVTFFSILDDKEVEAFKKISFDYFRSSDDRNRILFKNEKNNTLMVFDLHDEVKLLTTLECSCKHESFSLDGRYLFVKCKKATLYDKDLLKIFDLDAGGKKIIELPYPSNGFELYKNSQFFLYEHFGKKMIYSVVTGKEVAYFYDVEYLDVDDSFNYCFVLSSCAKQSILTLYRLNHEAPCARVLSVADEKECVFFEISSDGKYFFVQRADNSLQIFDLKAGKSIARFTEIKSEIKNFSLEVKSDSVIKIDCKNGDVFCLFAPVGYHPFTLSTIYDAKKEKEKMNSYLRKRKREDELLMQEIEKEMGQPPKKKQKTKI